MEWVVTLFSVLIFIITSPIAIFICFKVVAEYERAIIFRLGRLSGGARGPGMFFILPCIDEYRKVDLRTVTFNVPQQEMLTKDSVTVTVDAVVYYRISDPLYAVIQDEDYSMSATPLKEASDVISASPSALQLRYLQTLSSISAEKISTIIFPLPMELLTPYLAKYAHLMGPSDNLVLDAHAAWPKTNL
ncbi:stomatin-like isoform X2 [Drosophila simulans]|uniref:stomatin-like isoform X2 n=1 Tax=Drosophila simulans TaxID=7240 RepID=UPI00192CE8CF|nr:stomatin-like isoform X2 [Drosophila simulans]